MDVREWGHAECRAAAAASSPPCPDRHGSYRAPIDRRAWCSSESASLFKCRSNAVQMAFKCRSNAVQMPFKCRSNAIQMPFKCRSNAVKIACLVRQ